MTILHIELTAVGKIGKNAEMLRTGRQIAVGITLHNLPEGLVAAAGYTYMPALRPIIAIMLHNIPEGVATAIPLTEAGMKTFKIALITHTVSVSLLLGIMFALLVDVILS